MLKNLKTDLSLFFRCPKDYLYSFRYSDKDCVKIRPFDPNSLICAKRLMKSLSRECPILKLYLIGSAGLQIDGRGDIDILATAPSSKFAEALSRTERLLGKPWKARKRFIEWKLIFRKFSVELTLTTEQDKRFQEQIRLFNLLKNNGDYLNEYRNLKKELNEHSTKEYVRRRMEFFCRILSTAD